MKTSLIGYPRIGAFRELKFAVEKYFAGTLSEDGLYCAALELRASHWKFQSENAIDFIPSNDFSLYDNLLDTAVLLGAVPKRYRDLRLCALGEYFAMARGYQGENGDVKALAMKKWFNTNYHYIVPEIGGDTRISLIGTKPFDEFLQAKNLGITTKPVIIGPFTFLKLARFTGEKTAEDFTRDFIRAYREILAKLGGLGASWVQLDEPSLVTDLSEKDIRLFTEIYSGILLKKGAVKVLLQTYFGDIRDCYREITAMDFDGIGLDFVEGATAGLIERYGFPEDKTLFAGVVNGKNIWRNNYANTVKLIENLQISRNNIVIGSSCSLLHVPYTLSGENKLADEQKRCFAFAEEKVGELTQLKKLLSDDALLSGSEYRDNEKLFSQKRNIENKEVLSAVSSLSENDFIRLPNFTEREKIQKAILKLPLLPTTTIGSFPQTSDVKSNRRDYKNGKISFEEYVSFNKRKIAECIALQEKTGLDVLVHGEFERGDMVEYFGENLDGFLFTERGYSPMAQGASSRRLYGATFRVSSPLPWIIRYTRSHLLKSR